MEASKFRAAQETLKDRYRKDAKAALLTLKAKGTADDSTVTCQIETGRGLAVAGIHPKSQGREWECRVRSEPHDACLPRKGSDAR